MLQTWVIALVCAAASASSVCQAFADDQTPTLTITRTHKHAKALLNATALLEGLVAQKASRDVIMRTLEAEALEAAAAKSEALRKTATDISVQIIYERTGAISPAYQVATFEGFEKLAIVTAPLDKHKLQDAAAAVRDGKPAPFVNMRLTGKLPPEIL